MNTASVSNRSYVASGPAKGPECGPWSDLAINGCISMGLWSLRAERPVGCSCRRSIPWPFLSLWPLLPKNKRWGQRNICSWSWIKLAGTRVPISRFLKGCTSCSCHLIRQSCNQQNACGPSQTNRLPIGSGLRLTNWNRSKPSAVAGYKLIPKVFGAEPLFIGGLLWTLPKRI